jgi:hypothetical protein
VGTRESRHKWDKDIGNDEGRLNVELMCQFIKDCHICTISLESLEKQVEEGREEESRRQKGKELGTKARQGKVPSWRLSYCTPSLPS